MAAHAIFSTHQQHQLFTFAGKLAIAALALTAAGVFLPGPTPADAAERILTSTPQVAPPCAAAANQ